MRVEEVKPGDRARIRRFANLPFDIYRDEPLWVPPLSSEISGLFDRTRHPFFGKSKALFMLAVEGGDTLGRLAVLDNREYNEHTGSEDAFFCYFETVKDQGVAQALFQRGFEWAKSRGLSHIVGSKGLLHGDGLGILVEGFQHPPALGIPYHRSYYGAFLEELGFSKQDDFLSGHLTDEYQLPDRLHRIAERVMERREYHVKRFHSRAELRQSVPLIRRVYNTAFADAPGFYPMGEREIQMVAERLLAVADPDLIKLVFQGDELVGFLLAYPNIGPGIRRARGHMWPLGWLHMLWERSTTRVLDINGVGVLPKHQGAGANAVMYVEMEKSLRGSRYRHADMVQIREDNLKSMGDMQALGVKWYKRHRIYEREL